MGLISILDKTSLQKGHFRKKLILGPAICRTYRDMPVAYLQQRCTIQGNGHNHQNGVRGTKLTPALAELEKA